MARLFVGNLSFDVTEVELRAAFAVYGKVTSADIVMDAQSGGSRGFGFIEMLQQAHTMAAIEGLDGSILKGRTINVSLARARSENGRRGSEPRGWAVVGDGRHRW